MQLYAPLVLLHTASTLQLCVPVTHSSISEKEGSFYLDVSFIINFDGAVLNEPNVSRIQCSLNREQS